MLLDILAGILILGGAWFGARRGLASQVAGLLSLVAGFVVAIPLSASLAPYLGPKGPLNRLMALAMIYTVVSLTLYAAAFRFHNVIQRWKLEHWDRHLGAILGAIKGCFLAVTLTFFALTLVSGLREPILKTSSGRLMGRLVRTLHPVLPPEVHDLLHPYHHLLDDPRLPTSDPERTRRIP